jgi:phosphoglycolate phosphatase-like HAD superfamily hydrolase
MLFLFDIDGTLLRQLPPTHREALRVACRTVCGVDVDRATLGLTAGMTDSAILRRMLLAAGMAEAEITAALPALCTAAADAYDRLVEDDLRAYHTPHAAAAVDWLVARGATLGLVTGNIQRIAWRKLGAAGLAGPFHFGAFGDESANRDDLPPLALARARDHAARDFALEQVYVVGDTPADIACGQASNLRTIAVATGPEHNFDHLGACLPDYLLPDLGGLMLLDL